MAGFAPHDGRLRRWQAVAALALAMAIAAAILVAIPTARAGIPICDLSAAPSTSVMVTTPVTVTGTGFVPNAPIVITLTPPGNPGGVQSGTTDGAGAFGFAFFATQVGNWVVTFSQDGGCSDSITISATCVADLTATPSTSVPVGDLVTVTGTGFVPSSTIIINLQPPGNPGGVQSGTTNASGTFVLTFTANVVGNWLVAYSQDNGCSDSVTITAGAAGGGPTPAPSGTGLPDTAAGEPTESAVAGWVLFATLVLWIAIVLTAVTARSRRPA